MLRIVLVLLLSVFFASCSKDKEDIYTPKTYPKKQKNKSFFDEEILPEYIADKQRIRDKRRNDKKYKNKNKRGY